MNSPTTRWRFLSTCLQTRDPSTILNMKYIIKTFTIALTLILTICMLSCDFDESRHHLSGGVLLDDEKISEIKNEVLSEATKADENKEEKTEAATPKPIEENTEEQNDVVYWTESGTVWHKNADCSHIKNSSKIFSGKISDAQDAGKSKACSRCFD